MRIATFQLHMGDLVQLTCNVFADQDLLLCGSVQVTSPNIHVSTFGCVASIWPLYVLDACQTSLSLVSTPVGHPWE